MSSESDDDGVDEYLFYVARLSKVLTLAQLIEMALDGALAAQVAQTWAVQLLFEVLYQVPVDQRIDLLGEVLVHRGDPPEPIIGDLRELFELRNKFAHGQRMEPLPDQLPDQIAIVIRRRGKARRHLLDRAEVDRILAAGERLLSDLFNLGLAP